MTTRTNIVQAVGIMIRLYPEYPADLGARRELAAKKVGYKSIRTISDDTNRSLSRYRTKYIRYIQEVLSDPDSRSSILNRLKETTDTSLSTPRSDSQTLKSSKVVNREGPYVVEAENAATEETEVTPDVAAYSEDKPEATSRPNRSRKIMLLVDLLAVGACVGWIVGLWFFAEGTERQRMLGAVVMGCIGAISLPAVGYFVVGSFESVRLWVPRRWVSVISPILVISSVVGIPVGASNAQRWFTIPPAQVVYPQVAIWTDIYGWNLSDGDRDGQKEITAKKGDRLKFSISYNNVNRPNSGLWAVNLRIEPDQIWRDNDLVMFAQVSGDNVAALFPQMIVPCRISASVCNSISIPSNGNTILPMQAVASPTGIQIRSRSVVPTNST